MITPKVPRFELKRVIEDGTESEPMIVPVSALPLGTQMGRRGFLGASALGTAVALAMLEQNPSEAADFELDAELVKIPRAHQEPINALTIAFQGRVLVSASDDETVKLWSLPNGRLLRSLADHEAEVKALATMAGGALVCSGSLDGTIKVWSLGKGGLIEKSIKSAQSVTSLASSPVGSLLAAGGTENLLELWAIPKGKKLNSLRSEAGEISHLALSTEEIFVAIKDSTGIRKLKLPKGTPLGEIKAHGGEITALVCSTKQKILASASTDRDVKVWSLPGAELKFSLEGHNDIILSVAISEDGKLMALGSMDRSVSLRSQTDGSLIATLKGHEAEVTSLAFTPDGKMLASADYEGSIILWDLESHSPISWLTDPKATSTTVEISTYESIESDGQTITYTVPCSVPVPPSATCLCNCVPVGNVKLGPESTWEQEFVLRSERAIAKKKAKDRKEAARRQRARYLARNLPPGAPRGGAPGDGSPSAYRRRQAASGGRSRGGSSRCTCVPVCTCVPIAY